MSSVIPTVVNNAVVNNTIDLGEGIYWLGRYNGYFYANGEIIKYDAVEYSVGGTGNVWISSVLEYQKYFATLPYNGKIYPTGKVRIYSEPYYDTENSQLQSGAVAKHGRGQFGTSIVEHPAGLSDTWTNPTNTKSCFMYSTLLTSTTPVDESGNPIVASKT